ncbi:hypothetical protein GGS24DRAFT_506898 [Hypoxylon argillaceum]|nr:hypothetical protein GGS24DRAFT_506898 [Hypoxylon argillaceum]
MSATQSRITQLASIVASSTQKIDEYIAQNSLPYPSFDPDAPADLGLPPDLEKQRAAVLEATQGLNDLLQGPRELLFNHRVYNHYFDIANQVLVNREITYGNLAAKVGVNEAALSRILRLGIADRVFRELRPGVISHSPISRQMADDPNMADWASSNVNEMWPFAEKLVEALKQWPLAEEPN